MNVSMSCQGVISPAALCDNVTIYPAVAAAAAGDITGCRHHQPRDGETGPESGESPQCSLDAWHRAYKQPER